jgi:hypothetical protein
VNTIDVLIKRARVAAGISWEAGEGSNKTESQEPEVRNILRDCANELERLQRELDSARHGYREYEEKYILPCFKWAKEIGYDLQEAVLQNPGHNCVELLVAHLTKKSNCSAQDLEAVKLASKAFAETIEGVREALGQESTHYLVVPGDVKELVTAVAICDSDGGCRAFKVLERLREQGRR